MYSFRFFYSSAFRHLKAHEREAMDCGCDIVFESPTEKKKHVMLHHSDGKFAGCDRCSWVGYKNSLQNHVEAYHKEYICDICGKV